MEVTGMALHSRENFRLHLDPMTQVCFAASDVANDLPPITTRGIHLQLFTCSPWAAAAGERKTLGEEGHEVLSPPSWMSVGGRLFSITFLDKIPAGWRRYVSHYYLISAAL